MWRRIAIALSALTLSAAPAAAGSGAAVAETPRRAPVPVKVASFNILGSNHTVHSRRWDSGVTRAKRAVRWLRREGVTVAGLQEAQQDQMRVFVRSGEWRSYPNPRTAKNTETAQSVAWRSSVWKKARARTFTIPFHYTQKREQPMVLLRHRATGRKMWVVSVHLTSGRSARAEWERNVGTKRLVKNVTRLRRTGFPVLVTGDMNEHGEFFCDVTARTNLSTPAGGWNGGKGCTPPRSMRIDWIFASPSFDWQWFRFAEDSLLRRITDHTVPVATGTLR